MAEDGTFEEYGVADIKDVITCTDCGIQISGVTSNGAHTTDLIVDVSSDEDDNQDRVCHSPLFVIFFSRKYLILAYDMRTIETPILHLKSLNSSPHKRGIALKR